MLQQSDFVPCFCGGRLLMYHVAGCSHWQTVYIRCWSSSSRRVFNAVPSGVQPSRIARVCRRFRPVVWQTWNLSFLFKITPHWLWNHIYLFVIR